MRILKRVRKCVGLKVFEKGGKEKYQIELEKFILALQQKLLHEFYNKILLEAIKLFMKIYWDIARFSIIRFVIYLPISSCCNKTYLLVNKKMSPISSPLVKGELSRDFLKRYSNKLTLHHNSKLTYHNKPVMCCISPCNSWQRCILTSAWKHTNTI